MSLPHFWRFGQATALRSQPKMRQTHFPSYSLAQSAKNEADSFSPPAEANLAAGRAIVDDQQLDPAYRQIEQSFVQEPFVVAAHERYSGGPVQAVREILARHRLSDLEQTQLQTRRLNEPASFQLERLEQFFRLARRAEEIGGRAGQVHGAACHPPANHVQHDPVLPVRNDDARAKLVALAPQCDQ